MRTRTAVLHVLLLAPLLAACDDDDGVAPDDTTLLPLVGNVAEVYLGEPVVPGAEVRVHTFGGVGSDRWTGATAVDTTDAGGNWALEVEVPGGCEPDEEVSVVVTISAHDFREASHGSLDDPLVVACDTDPQSLSFSLYREAFRSPQPLDWTAMALRLGVGRSHACAVSNQGTMCWGRQGWGALGSEVFGEAAASPTPIRDDPGLATVSAGDAHTCALDHAGAAWCWGQNGSGQFGVDPATAGQATSLRVAVAGGLAFEQVVAGRQQSCGLTADGEVWCWGQGGLVGAGHEPFDVVHVPVRVELPEVERLSASFAHTCALTVEKEAWCWGFAYGGELGSADDPSGYTLPVRVAGDLDWVAISAGTVLTCALSASGAPYCWGRDTGGRLGFGEVRQAGSQDAATPHMVVGDHHFVAITAGGSHACGLKADGEAWCWGNNDHGQLGRASDDNDAWADDHCRRTECAPWPVRVDTPLRFRDIQAGDRYTCAVTATDDRVYCWGDREFLGSGRHLIGDG